MQPTPLPTASETAIVTVEGSPIAPMATVTPSPIPRGATWWTGPSDPGWLAASEETRLRISQVIPGLSVNVSGGHADFGRVVGGVASGQAPDVLDVGTLETYAARGILRKLSLYLDKNGTLSANYLPAVWANGGWQGDTYGVPALDHGPELALVWNQSLAGNRLTSISAPTSWDDLLTSGKALTQRDDKGGIRALGFDPLDGVGGLLDTARDVTGYDWFDAKANRSDLSNAPYTRLLESVATYFQSLGIADVNQFRQDVPPLTNTPESGVDDGRQLAILTGYWSIAELAKSQRDAGWTFAATWVPTRRADAHVQRVGGRVATIPTAASRPDDGWELIRFLAGDDANLIFWRRAGRFATTRSLGRTEVLRRTPGLAFFLASLDQANVVTSRESSPVAGFAQAKWEQAIQDLLAGGKSVADSLAAAQKATDTELKRLGG